MKKGLPTQDIATLEEREPDFIAETLEALDKVRAHQQKIKTDGEVKERIDQYFAGCIKHGMRPGVEGLAYSLGISRVTLWHWCNGDGCSKARQEFVQSALQRISAFLEQANLCGKLNPATGIFLLKNWCGYADGQQLTLINGNEAERHITADEIGERLGFIDEEE